MPSLNVSRVGNVKYVLPLRTPRQQRSIGPHGHRAAVVLSPSGALRNSLERALLARGAAVVNLRTLPPLRQVEDILASGLILLAPPSYMPHLKAADCVEAAEGHTAQAVVDELELRGVLLPRGFIFPGEGI